MSYRGNLSGIFEDLRPLVSCRIAPVGGFDSHNLGGLAVVALVDTGATDVSLRPNHISCLGLSSFGMVHTNNVGFAGEVPGYMIDVAFDMVGLNGSPFRVKVSGAQALSPPSFDNSYQAIIGMNVLSSFSVILEGGSIMLRYR